MLDFSKVISAFLTAVMAGCAVVLLSGAVNPEAQYVRVVQTADVHFQVAENRCGTGDTPQFRLCIAVALADKWRTVADADVKLHKTAEARHAQRVMNAGGNLIVALQKCAAQAIWEQSNCREQAKDVFRREVSRARVVQAHEHDCASGSCARRAIPRIMVKAVAPKATLARRSI